MQSLRLILTCWLALASVSCIAEDKLKANILWIIAEDMSPDLGCYGNTSVKTPHMDILAGKGMLFRKVFTTSPACSPSRTAIATGIFQTTLGAHHMRYSEALKPALPVGVMALPDILRKQNYFTGNIRNICGTGTGKDDWLFKTADRIWDSHSWEPLIRNQPFYAQINSSNSHRPFSATPSDAVNEENIVIPPYYPDHPVTRKDWTGYLREIVAFDNQVGRILEKLEKEGLSDRTIVCVLADHGRPMIRGKNWLYDSGTHIPLIIYFPPGIQAPEGYQAGTESDQLISAIDLTAETVLMAGGVLPEQMQGRSFLRKESPPREAVFSAADRFGNIESGSRAIRTSRYKYIRNHKRPGSINDSTTAYRRAKHPIHHLLNIMHERNLLTAPQRQLLMPLVAEELYDLKSDPYEINNLAQLDEHQATRKLLADKLDAWLSVSKDQGLKPDSDEIAEHFRKYGEVQMKRNEVNIRNARNRVLNQLGENIP